MPETASITKTPTESPFGKSQRQKYRERHTALSRPHTDTQTRIHTPTSRQTHSEADGLSKTYRHTATFSKTKKHTQILNPMYTKINM